MFQQVMHGVRGKIDTFCHQLQVRLLEPSCPIAEKKQLLKYLVEFDRYISLTKERRKTHHYIMCDEKSTLHLKTST